MFCVISHNPQAQSVSEVEITTLPDGSLRFDSPWNPGLKDALKREIPATDRRPVYQGDKFKYWAVTPQHGKTLADLAERFHMGRPEVPEIENDPWDSVGDIA